MLLEGVSQAAEMIFCCALLGNMGIKAAYAVHAPNPGGLTPHVLHGGENYGLQRQIEKYLAASA